MLTGPEALLRIDGTIERARGEVASVRQSLSGLNERELSLRASMREALEQLAAYRLDAAERDRFTASASDVGPRVETLMRKRTAELDELGARATAIDERIAGLDQRRSAAADQVASVSEALDTAEAELQEVLEGDAAYQDQLAKSEAADAVATGAEQKHELAEEDRKTKGAPYEDDPLFTYLWKRGYGTSAYRGSGIIRMLDGWVARICAFEPARRNYHMLLEIPKRLAEHVARMRERADIEIDALVALEQAARDKTELPSLEQQLKEARGAVEAIDAEIATLRIEARETSDKRGAFERGEDPLYGQAVDAVVAVLDGKSIKQLREAARRTRFPEDDAIVENLVDIEDELEEIEHERDEFRDLSRRYESRLDELEDLRVEFRRRRYDDYSSEFADDNLFGVILTELLRGAISGAAYWERVDRNHRRRARRSKPDFGSGRFRFPGPLSFPGARKGSRGSFGGFRTGGRMSGGGGFRTGGGF